jgi:hypothetical protein
MKVTSVVMLGSSVVSAVAAAMLLSSPAEAQSGGWSCGFLLANAPHPLGCYAAESTCYQGALEWDGEMGSYWCDPASMGVTNCCTSGLQT